VTKHRLEVLEKYEKLSLSRYEKFLPSEYMEGCGYSADLNNRNKRWQVNLAPASASFTASPRPANI